MTAPCALQSFHGSAIDQGLAVDSVLDVAVNDNGSWLAVVTTTMVHVYHFSGLTSNKDVNEDREETEQGAPGSSWGKNKTFNRNMNSSSGLVSSPPGWELITVMQLTENDGIVVSAAWAPSSLYTTTLALCSYLGIVSLKRLVVELPGAADFSMPPRSPYFEEIYRTVVTPPPACCVAWAPSEFGRMFAVGGSVDSSVSIFTGVDGVWLKETLYPPDISTSASSGTQGQASPLLRASPACASVCFGPILPSSALLTAPLFQDNEGFPNPAAIAPLQLFSCDRGKYVWLWERQPLTSEGDERDADGRSAPSSSIASNSNLPKSGGSSSSTGFGWALKGALPLSSPFCPSSSLHGDPTGMPFNRDPSWREVSWAKSEGLPFHYVAAGAEEGFVAIWEHDEEEWKLVLADQSSSSHGAVTRLSWSEVGTFLLVSYTDGHVAMWKETNNDGWKIASELDNTCEANC